MCYWSGPETGKDEAYSCWFDVEHRSQKGSPEQMAAQHERQQLDSSRGPLDLVEEASWEEQLFWFFRNFGTSMQITKLAGLECYETRESTHITLLVRMCSRRDVLSEGAPFEAATGSHFWCSGER